jgi:hypothetical protein
MAGGMQLAAEVGMLWFAVGAAEGQGAGIERLLPQLASILRFSGELERRLAGDGLGGLAPVCELHRRVMALLAALAPDVARARGTVADLIAALRAMEETLAAVRRLKGEMGRAP